MLYTASSESPYCSGFVRNRDTLITILFRNMASSREANILTFTKIFIPETARVSVSLCNISLSFNVPEDAVCHHGTQSYCIHFFPVLSTLQLLVPVPGNHVNKIFNNKKTNNGVKSSVFHVVKSTPVSTYWCWNCIYLLCSRAMSTWARLSPRLFKHGISFRKLIYTQILRNIGWI